MTGRPHRVRYNATSLARALTILDLFEPGTPTLSATQIARSLRVRPGSLYPALGTLERFGYLERRPDKRFRLGLKLLERGHTILLHLDLYERARPALRQLAQALSANAHLAVLHQGQVLYLGREEAAPSAVFPSIVGRLVPAHCTALGVAAISVSLLRARVTEARLEKIAQEVVRTAARISGAMGYRPA